MAFPLGLAVLAIPSVQDRILDAVIFLLLAVIVMLRVHRDDAKDIGVDLARAWLGRSRGSLRCRDSRSGYAQAIVRANDGKGLEGNQLSPGVL